MHPQEHQTVKIRAVRFRDQLERENFTATGRTEMVPVINSSETEAVPVVDEQQNTRSSAEERAG
jgi:hypothetical protein